MNQTHKFANPLEIALEISFPEQLTRIEQKLDKLMATVAELTGIITQANDQLTKALNEINAAIANLSNQNLPPEADAALQALKDAAQKLDDVIPDAPPA